MTKERFLEIVNIMISEGLLDKSSLLDRNYVINRVALYVKAKEFVDNNSENSHLLRYVLLSCSYKIYVQNITLGDIKNIDNIK